MRAVRFLALLLSLVSSGQQPVRFLSVSLGVSIRPAARMPLRRGNFWKRSSFQWGAGGLDLNEKSLAALTESPEPPQVPPANLRTYLENKGYTVRTKISKSDLAKMKNKGQIKSESAKDQKIRSDSAKSGSQICAAASSAQGSCSSSARGQQPGAQSATLKRSGQQPGASRNTSKSDGKQPDNQKGTSAPASSKGRGMKQSSKRRGQQPGKTKDMWIVLKEPDLRKLYDRHRTLVLCSNARLREEQAHVGTSGASHSDTGIAWWVDEDGNSCLSDNNVFGLTTSVEIAGLKPLKLYGYKKPDNLPVGVDWHDAELLLPDAEWRQRRKSGSKPANIADLGKLRAVQLEFDQFGAKYVWMFDLDLHWVAPAAPSAEAAESGTGFEVPAAAFEHVVGTMKNKPGCQAGKICEIKKSMCEFLQFPCDGVTAVPPMRFTHRSPLPTMLLQKTEAALLAKPDDYINGSVMGCIAESLIQCGLLGACRKTTDFCAIPFYSGFQPVHDYSVHGVTADSVIAGSWGQNTCWQTGKGVATTLFDRGSHELVRPGSLWQRLVEKLREEMQRPTPGGARNAMRGQQPAIPFAGNRRFQKKVRDPTIVVDPIAWSSLEHASADVPTLCLPSRPSPFAQQGVCSEWSTSAEQRPMNASWLTCSVRRSVQLLSKLGDGSFGSVYKGQIKGVREFVALKICKSGRLHKAVDATEIAMTARVQGNDNVIKLWDWFCGPFWSVMVTSYHDTDIFRLLQEKCPQGGLQPVVAFHVAREVCKGAEYFHALEIIHRDLHAANVLASMGRDWQPGFEISIQDLLKVCVADFGCGCDTRGDKPNILRSAGVCAEAARAPELWLSRSIGREQRYDTPLDVWSIGVLLVQMLLGNAHLRKFLGASDFHAFWETLIGPLSNSAAKKLGWVLQKPTSLALDATRGLQPLVDGPTGEPSGRTTCHTLILKWDPGQRFSAKHLCGSLQGKIAMIQGVPTGAATAAASSGQQPVPTGATTAAASSEQQPVPKRVRVAASSQYINQCRLLASERVRPAASTG